MDEEYLNKIRNDLNIPDAVVAGTRGFADQYGRDNVLPRGTAQWLLQSVDYVAYLDDVAVSRIEGLTGAPNAHIEGVPSAFFRAGVTLSGEMRELLARMALAPARSARTIFDNVIDLATDTIGEGLQELVALYDDSPSARGDLSPQEQRDALNLALYRITALLPHLVARAFQNGLEESLALAAAMNEVVLASQPFSLESEFLDDDEVSDAGDDDPEDRDPIHPTDVVRQWAARNGLHDVRVIPGRRPAGPAPVARSRPIMLPRKLE